MTYADEGVSATATGVTGQVVFSGWKNNNSNFVSQRLNTNGGRTGEVVFGQREDSSGYDFVESLSDTYTPGINVPFNIASRHGSTFINGAVEGTALTADTTPVALPDLSATDMQIGSTFMGTIKLFRVWADDLTDEGISTATLPSLEPSLSLTFDGSNNSFTVLDWSE